MSKPTKLTVSETTPAAVVVPFTSEEYHKLLFKIPVKDWEFATNFLFKRHLLHFPSSEAAEKDQKEKNKADLVKILKGIKPSHYDMEPVLTAINDIIDNVYDDEDNPRPNNLRVADFTKVITDNIMDVIIGEIDEPASQAKKLAAREKHLKLIEEQKAAKAAREERKKKHHERMLEEQKIASQKREAKREQSHKARMEVASQRIAKANEAETQFKDLTKAADVNRLLKAKVDGILANKAETLSAYVRETVATLPPLNLNRTADRAIRVVDAAKTVWKQGESVFDGSLIMETILRWFREADIRLQEIYHESWVTVGKRNRPVPLLVPGRAKK